MRSGLRPHAFWHFVRAGGRCLGPRPRGRAGTPGHFARKERAPLDAGTAVLRLLLARQAAGTGMDWTRQIDAYCERLDASYWAEPVNAVTNAAFLIAAFVMWRRVRGAGLPLAMALVWVLAAIGVGSYLFHTHAQTWSALAAVVPIILFILIYIYAANRHFWGLSRLWSGLGVAAFFPYAAVTVPLFQMVPGLGSSAGYAPVPVLILAYAWALRRRAPETARGLTLGAGLLILSLGFRTADMALCPAVPVGTHFMWHILNGIMLGWMIEVYRRHMLAGRRGAR